MKPMKINLEIWQGKTYEEEIFFTDKNQQPINLTGYSARMQIRTAIQSSDILFELSSDDSTITIDPLDGKVTLLIDADDTASFTNGSYKYDLELITGSGRTYGPLFGSVKVMRQVTR